MSVGTFAGFAGNSIAGLAPAFVFVGPTVTVTVATNTDRLVTSAEAPLGSSGGSDSFAYGVCYKSGAGPVTNFVDGSYSVGQATMQSDWWAAAASVVPGAGTYQVGYCVWNFGPDALDNNDFVNGWVMVVDPPAEGPVADNVQPRP